VQDAEKLLKWWRINYCMRRLLLLGCTNDEIRSCPDYWYDLDSLYNALITNPLPVLCVAWETCLRIAEERCLTYIDKNGRDTKAP